MLNCEDKEKEEIENTKAQWLLHAFNLITTDWIVLDGIPMPTHLGALQRGAGFLREKIERMDNTTQVFTRTILNPLFNRNPEGNFWSMSEEILYQNFLDLNEKITSSEPVLDDWSRATLNVITSTPGPHPTKISIIHAELATVFMTVQIDCRLPKVYPWLSAGALRPRSLPCLISS
jgi:hypothetical protein